MARNLDALLQDLKHFDHTKSASADPESATDPSESGVATAVPDELHQPSGADVSLANIPEGGTMPGGIEKTPEGSGPTPPAGQPFVTNGKDATAMQKSIGDLRNKLANFQPTAAAVPAAAAQAPAAAAPVADPTKQAAAPSEIEGFGKYHLLIAANLMKSAAGRQQMSDALDEVMGQEACRELLKKATAEQGEFEAGYLQEKIAAAERYEFDKQAAAESAELARQYAELTKNASAEEIAAIDQSLLIMKQAEALFAENPVAHQAFLTGVGAANKFAAAMPEGAPPESLPPGPEGAMPPGGEEAMGGMSPEGPPSPEELQAALMELVQAGALTPEQAEQLLAQLLGGAEGGGGAPPEGAGAPPEAPPEEVQKAAAFLDKVASVIF